MLLASRTRNDFGDTAFSAAGSRVWNKLYPRTKDTFKQPHNVMKLKQNRSETLSFQFNFVVPTVLDSRYEDVFI